MNCEIKGILFDLDGTLLDTADDLGAALNFVLTERGFPAVSELDYRSQASNGVNALLQLGFKNSLSDFDLSELRSQFLTYYGNNIYNKSALFSGINTLITTIEKASIPWGIVTNKPAFLTNPLVAQIEQFTNCATTVSGDTLPYSKPHPAPMLLAAEQLNVECEHILYVGDAQRDIEAGNAANMITAAALWGYIASDENPIDWQADILLNQATDITPLFS